MFFGFPSHFLEVIEAVVEGDPPDPGKDLPDDVFRFNSSR
jgi:hypothetical protein